MNAEFSSSKELKERIMPALTIRVKQLKEKNLNVTEEYLWEFFSKKWKNGHDLTLADIVDDVLNADVGDNNE